MPFKCSECGQLYLSSKRKDTCCIMRNCEGTIKEVENNEKNK
jgi:hypothetical protein